MLTVMFVNGGAAVAQPSARTEGTITDADVKDLNVRRRRRWWRANDGVGGFGKKDTDYSSAGLYLMPAGGDFMGAARRRR